MKKLLAWIVSLYTHTPTEKEEPAMADPELNGTVAAGIAAAPAAAEKAELEKLEELIETYSLDSIEKVKAAISFIRSAL